MALLTPYTVNRLVLPHTIRLVPGEAWITIGIVFRDGAGAAVTLGASATFRFRVARDDGALGADAIMDYTETDGDITLDDPNDEWDLTISATRSADLTGRYGTTRFAYQVDMNPDGVAGNLHTVKGFVIAEPAIA